MTDLAMTDLTPFLLTFFLGVVAAIGVGTIAGKIMKNAQSVPLAKVIASS
ncbi:MAG: hypothetical protein OXI52_12550 [Caldilineaceae bacterium]|nr:hypothetical protein [Caldilineaceae bacterium]